MTMGIDRDALMSEPPKRGRNPHSKRRDFRYHILRGDPAFSWAAYACIITQSTAYPDERAIYHIECFFGHNATETRAKARRYGSAVCRGWIASGGRNQRLPHIFPAFTEAKPEREIATRNSTL